MLRSFVNFKAMKMVTFGIKNYININFDIRLFFGVYLKL